MNKLKQRISALLVAIMLLTMVPTAFAAIDDTGFSDVAANAWYAAAVSYVQTNSLMSGTAFATFSPDTNIDRAMLAAILYRISDNPAVSETVTFADVTADDYYAAAAAWAVTNDVMTPGENGFFGGNESVSRQEIAHILWRHAGRPSAEASVDFADETMIAPYAAAAVDWARANEVINGKENNYFDPNGNVTRAQMAAIIQNYMTLRQKTIEQSPITDDNRILVAYFSATGNTKTVADIVATTLKADLYEIVPETAYTSDDLNWTNPSSRVNAEHNDPSFRPAIAGDTKDLSNYDTILLGYPIWWGEAPNIVWNFVESSDLANKTIIPFCTSSSSGLGSSGETLQALSPNADWQNGQRFSGSVEAATVRQWALSLNLPSNTTVQPALDTTPTTPEKRSLVVYFSMPETADPNNMTQDEAQSTVVIDNEVLGNTQYMAYIIQQTADADIFRIEPETPYPTDHRTLVDLAADEQDKNARPAIKNSIPNWETYDTIFVGYPIWWSDMPMILYTFFDQYDFSGKTLVPFSTHGGSGFAGTPTTIERLEPNAKMQNGLTISRDRIQDAEKDIIDWVNGLKQN